jgi:hypothetical protein
MCHYDAPPSKEQSQSIQEHYCMTTPVKSVPTSTNPCISSGMRRYLFPGAHQDKGK